MEELRRFQGSFFEHFREEKLIEVRDTILEFTAKIPELQNEMNCMNDSRDFQGIPRYQSTSVFPTFSKSRCSVEPQKSAAKYLAHMVYLETFLHQRRLLQHLVQQESNSWISNVSEHTSPHVMNESQTPERDQRCQSGPSARNSFDLSEGGFEKNYGADQQRSQISDPHFDKFTMSATFARWKMRVKTEACIFSQFPADAMLWIKEVEMVESVDDLKNFAFYQRNSWVKFEVLDPRIAIALNKIINNTRFKKKVQSGGPKSPKGGPFPSRKTGRLPDLRALPGHWSQ